MHTVTGLEQQHIAGLGIVLQRLHQFIRILRELANVTVTPGTEFGPQFLHQFRINFSQDKEKAVAAIERFLIVLERYRKK